MQKKHYLVTGGAGFVGSNLVDRLIADGHSVTIIDNLSTGKRENINPKAKFVKADIRDLKKIKPYFKKKNGVFHVAALPRVQPSIKNPLDCHDVNITGTLNVLWAAKEAKIKRIVYSASSSAYGDPEKLPAHEDLRHKPMSPYALQKFVGEEYCKLFSLLYGVETVSLRYFNVYGPRMIDTGAYVTVIKTFLNQRAKKKPLTIVGDGNQSRDFTHVFDICNANILAMENNNIGKGEVVNIGPGKSYTVNQIAALIGGKTKKIPERLEPRHSLADNTKARTILGWIPKENLESTIAKFLSGEYA